MLAFGLLILYHAGFAWTGWGWHLDSDRDAAVARRGDALHQPLAHPADLHGAGGAIVLALGQRSAGAFAIDRIRRLLLPLVFGVLVLVPPQVYLEQH